MGNRSKEEVLEELLEQVGNLLEELFQSGFDTVHDSTLKEAGELVSLTAQYGMEYLSGLLEKLLEGLSMRRHRLERQEDGMAGIYVELNEYLYLCREKTVYDRGLGYYAKDRKDGENIETGG